MIPMGLIWRGIGIAVCVSLAAAGIAYWNHYQRNIGRAQVQAKWDAANAGAARQAFATSERRLKETQNAQDATDAERRRLAAARDAARTERERLRDVAADAERRIVAASDAEPACRTDATAAVTLELFGACAGQYESVEGEAAELAARLRGLQRYVAAACPGAEVAIANDGRPRWDR